MILELSSFLTKKLRRYENCLALPVKLTAMKQSSSSRKNGLTYAIPRDKTLLLIEVFDNESADGGGHHIWWSKQGWSSWFWLGTFVDAK